MRTYNTRIKLKFYAIGWTDNNGKLVEVIKNNLNELESEINTWAVVHGIQFIFESIAEKIIALEKIGFFFKEYER